MKGKRTTAWIGHEEREQKVKILAKCMSGCKTGRVWEKYLSGLPG